MDRILYFGYVIFTSWRHRKKLHAFSRFYKDKYNQSSVYFLAQAYAYYFKYGMHPLDYFYYDVFGDKAFVPSEHASTLFMYRFHKKLNEKSFTKYFYNKILFHQKFKAFAGHQYFDLKQTEPKLIKNWISEVKPNFIIVKKFNSVGGFGVKKLNVQFNNEDVLLNNKPFNSFYKKLKSYDLLEEFVTQHEDLMTLNSSCLNTIRVVTILKADGEVAIPGAVIRLGVNSDVDNFHSGGIAVNINLETGKLQGEGFRLDPSAEAVFTHHPVTKVKLNCYQLPNWPDVLKTVKEAARVIPQVRTVGWDVALTPTGISLIEGNHDWDKIIIERALNRGIRKELENYL